MALNHDRIDNLEVHFKKSAKHQKMVNRQKEMAKKRNQSEPTDGLVDISEDAPTTAKEQKTVKSLFAKQKSASEQKEEVINDLLQFHVRSDIPLAKIDHPQYREFLQKHVRNGGSIPQESTLRTEWLPPLLERNRQKVLDEIHAAAELIVMVDESPNAQNQPMTNVLILPVKDEWIGGQAHPLMLDSKLLETVNHQTIAELVISTLNKDKINLSKVVEYVSDNVEYMKKSFTAILRHVLPNAVHVTCVPHILNLVAECWRAAFPDCDVLIAKMKSIFSKAPARRSRFLVFLLNRGLVAKLPPTPVLTRWGTWIAACVYHAEYLKAYREFVKEEVELAGESAALETLEEMLDEREDQLQADFDIIAKETVEITKRIVAFQSHDSLTPMAYNSLVDLRASLCKNVKSKKMRLRQASVKSVEKIEKYLTKKGQPGIEFLRASRLWNPRSMLEVQAADLPSLLLSAEAVAELPTYKALVMGEPELIKPDTTPWTFWLSMEQRLPALSKKARRCLQYVCASADVERSFSKYKAMARPNRLRMTADKTSLMLQSYFNPEPA